MGGFFSHHEPSWDDLPTTMDGWYVIHEAIRFDMKDIRKAIVYCQALAKKNRLDSDTINALWQFWEHFSYIVHEHHDHEEEVFFPWLSSRVELPPKMSSDHKTLLSNMDTVKNKLAAIKESPETSSSESFDDLLASWDTMESHMREHLKEEEDGAMLLLRKHFTPAEYHAQTQKVVAKTQWFELPQMLHWLDLEDRRRWMTIHGIPWLIRRFVIEPSFKRYDKTFRCHLDQVHTKAVECGVAA